MVAEGRLRLPGLRALGAGHAGRVHPSGPPRTPPLTVVAAVVAALRAHGAVAAVGGSGLLAALGLAERVRDWDLTTDAATDTVEAALASTGLGYTRVSAGEGRFETRARFCVPGGDHEVEVLVGFAVRDGDRLVPLPTRVGGHWRGLPVADPAVWVRAYRLLGREDRAERLQRWVDEQPQPRAPREEPGPGP